MPKPNDDTTKLAQDVAFLREEIRRQTTTMSEPAKEGWKGFWKPAINGLAVAAAVAAVGAWWGFVQQGQRLEMFESRLLGIQARIEATKAYPDDPDRLIAQAVRDANISTVRELGSQIGAMSRELATLTAQISELTRRLDRYELTKGGP